MDDKWFIITSNLDGPENWDGKSFQIGVPAKAFTTFDSAIDSLKGYWFHGITDSGVPQPDKRSIKITPISAKKLAGMLVRKEARL